MNKRVVHVVTNVDRYEDGAPTGLWLSELTHAWDHFAKRGFEQRIISPVGGRSPLEPRALKWPLLDGSAKAWLRDPRQMARLETTQRPEDIDPLDCDVLFFTGGHGVMWDFPDSPGLQTLTRAVWERGGIVAAVCHGYCALLNTRLTTGRLLVMDRMLTGFSWAEAPSSPLSLHRSAPGLFKEVADGHAEETRRFPEPGRGDAIGAALVFLDLLEREPERLTEVALAESQTAPAMSDPAADVNIHGIGPAIAVALLHWFPVEHQTPRRSRSTLKVAAAPDRPTKPPQPQRSGS